MKFSLYWVSLALYCYCSDNTNKENFRYSYVIDPQVFFISIFLVNQHTWVLASRRKLKKGGTVSLITSWVDCGWRLPDNVVHLCIRSRIGLAPVGYDFWKSWNKIRLSLAARWRVLICLNMFAGWLCRCLISSSKILSRFWWKRWSSDPKWSQSEASSKCILQQLCSLRPSLWIIIFETPEYLLTFSSGVW